MNPLKETTVYTPVSMEDAKPFKVDAILINSDIDSGETVYIIPKSLFVFTKEELTKFIRKVFNDGVNNGLEITTHSNKFKSDNEYINSLLK